MRFETIITLYSMKGAPHIKQNEERNLMGKGNQKGEIYGEVMKERKGQWKQYN